LGGEDGQQRQRQTAARRIPDDHNPLGSIRDKAPIGCDGIVDRGRERVLGRQAIIRNERIGTDACGDLAREMTNGLCRTEYIAAAVKVEYPRSRLCVGWTKPKASNAPDGGGSTCTSGAAGVVANMASNICRASGPIGSPL
jgi:hypothetical protein